MSEDREDAESMSANDLYRILIPSEYQALRDAIQKSKHRILIDTMLNTGMRYEELKRVFDDNALAWFDAKNRCIELPRDFSKTGERRTVHLTPVFSNNLRQYLREFKTLDFPRRAVMNENLRRWWCDANFEAGQSLNSLHDTLTNWYPTAKTFRKTWESYLLSVQRDDGSAKYDYMAICCSQGHSPQISYSYYANLDPRLKSCMDEVKKLTEGWMT